MRSPIQHAALGLAVLALALTGCKSKSATFQPEPVPPPTVVNTPSSTTAPPAQPLGTEGFKENALKGGDMGTGGVQEMTPPSQDITEDAVKAALKTIYFAYDSDELDADAMSTIAANAAWLKDHPKVKIQIEGHCDQRGTVEYNLALGARRARAVRAQYERLGIPADRLDVISWGKEHPAVEGDGEAVWSKNRRAEFRLLP